jgi:nucleoid-associated protein YgaU
VGGNVQRIYEFNRAVLKSEDVVTPGQKLRIPPLPATASSKPAKPEDVLPPSQFEKVAAMGKSNVTQPKVSTAAQVQTTASSGSGQTQADGRWYVVRENDNLWKIAAGQLGNGARFEEIVKLNGAILKDTDNLTPGTRLKLPAK